MSGAVAGVLFALLVPLALWPWAVTRVLHRFEIPHAATLGFVTGPLWGGWLLGLLVLLFPGSSPHFYTAFFVTAPLAAAAAGRAGALSGWRPAGSPLAWAGAAAAAAGVFFIAFNAAVYPTTEHDRLVVDLFADQLHRTWDFWGLPRYAPDDRGFYYPLAHPPAMMSLLAWAKSYAPWDWVARGYSAFLIAGIFVAAYRAANSLSEGAGVWAVFFLFSSSIFVVYLGNNSQDVFRYAAFCAALLATTSLRNFDVKPAVAAGAFYGLAASYHSLQLLFVGLVPLAALAVAGLRRRSLQQAVLMGGAAAAVAAYPYVSNYVALKAAYGLDTFLIPTRSMYTLKTAHRLMNELMVQYTGIETYWKTWIAGRLGSITNLDDAGYAGLVFLALAWAPFFVKGLGLGPREKRPLAIFAITAVVFVLLTMDPGDHFYRLTGQRFWVNRRYPQSIVPVMAVVAGVALRLALARLLPQRTAWLKFAYALVLAAGLALLVSPTRRSFALDTRIYFEPGQECYLCSDPDKLRNSRASGMYRAVAWLASQGRTCLTSREGEYFAWSNASGIIYYSPQADAAMSAPTVEAARDALRAAGVDCVLTDYALLGTNTLQARPFSNLGALADVWPVEFYEARVFLLQDAPVEYGPETELPLPVTGTSFRLPFPSAAAAEIVLERDDETPITIVGYGVGGGRQERFFLRNETPDRRVRVPMVQNGGYTELKFEFSRPVAPRRLTLRTVKLLD